MSHLIKTFVFTLNNQSSQVIKDYLSSLGRPFSYEYKNTLWWMQIDCLNEEQSNNVLITIKELLSNSDTILDITPDRYLSHS